MNRQMEMDRRAAFLKAYGELMEQTLTLPARLRDWAPVSCLKEGERSVFLLRREERLAVLKRQTVSAEDSLKAEFDLLQSLDHAQIPKADCFFQEDGVEYLIRAYVEGETLFDLVTGKGPMSEHGAITAAISVCQALQYLHQQRPPVIHRDMKPQNIILDSDGRCHLVDLGTARRYRPGAPGDTVFMGTQITAPPEQFGYQQTDARSDVYGVGMLLRFLLTGAYEPLEPAEGGATPALCRVVSRCTAFDPENRYPSVDVLIRELERARRWIGRRRGSRVTLAARLTEWTLRCMNTKR